MEDKERDDQRRDGDAVARKVEEILVGFDDQRNVAPRRLQHQRSEHDQEGHCQRRKGSDQGVADRFQPQPVPTPWLDHRISPVEPFEAKYTASTTPMVSASPRVVVSTSWISPDSESATCCGQICSISPAA